MKSKLFGLGSKLVLAMMAVGMTVTSCYDSESVDVITPATPAEAEYLIVGNITDAATGEIVANPTVTVDGAAVAVTNGYFQVENLEGGKSYRVVVDADGYRTASRTIYLQKIANGGQCVGNADFALVSLASAVLEPDQVAGSATQEQAEEAFAEVEETITAAFAEEVTVETAVDENGNTVLAAAAPVEAEAGADVPVEGIPYFTGFSSTVSQDYMTRAITDGQIWNASAGAYLGRSYGLVNVPRNYTLAGVDGVAIVGYKVTIVFTHEVLSFDGLEGIVTYQGSEEGSWSVVPVYDTQDSHDSHNQHGTTNGAGGGDSNQGY